MSPANEWCPRPGRAPPAGRVGFQVAPPRTAARSTRRDGSHSEAAGLPSTGPGGGGAPGGAALAMRRKYFCAWLRTCFTVRVPTALHQQDAVRPPSPRAAPARNEFFAQLSKRCAECARDLVRARPGDFVRVEAAVAPQCLDEPARGGGGGQSAAAVAESLSPNRCIEPEKGKRIRRPAAHLECSPLDQNRRLRRSPGAPAAGRRAGSASPADVRAAAWRGAAKSEKGKGAGHHGFAIENHAHTEQKSKKFLAHLALHQAGLSIRQSRPKFRVLQRTQVRLRPAEHLDIVDLKSFNNLGDS